MSKKQIVEQRHNIKVAKNFIASYGKEVFRQLLNDFVDGKSGQKIADELGVSRERVRQYKNHFGTTEHIYSPSDTVVDVIENGRTEIEKFGKTKTGKKRKMTKAERMIKNFVNNRGLNVFRRFIDQSVAIQSGQVMADKYNMSRERVRQFKLQFGTGYSIYTIHGYIQALRK